MLDHDWRRSDRSTSTVGQRDALSKSEVHLRLLRFLHNFVAAGVRIPPDAGMWDAHDAMAEELDATRRKLGRVLESGFWFSDEGDPPKRETEGIGWDDEKIRKRFVRVTRDHTRRERRHDVTRE